MKKATSIIICITVILMLGLLCACQVPNKNSFDCPDEVYYLLVNYHDNFGSEQAAELVYFNNQAARDDYLSAQAEMKEYRIKRIKLVDERDNIYEVLVVLRTTWHERHMSLTNNEFEAITIYVSKIQGEWKIIRNEDDLFNVKNGNMLW